MDAIQLLISDHRKVKALFELFKNEKSRRRQIMIFGSLFDELQTHAYIEESILYPACNQYPECKAQIEQAYAEHQRVKDQLDEVTSLPQDSRELLTRVTALMDNVIEHVQMEESELFPALHRHMNANELDLLGSQLQAAKQEVPDSWKMAA